MNDWEKINTGRDDALCESQYSTKYLQRSNRCLTLRTHTQHGKFLGVSWSQKSNLRTLQNEDKHIFFTLQQAPIWQMSSNQCIPIWNVQRCLYSAHWLMITTGMLLHASAFQITAKRPNRRDDYRQKVEAIVIATRAIILQHQRIVL